MQQNCKRTRIQDAALQLFQEQGIDATSVNEIVKRAQVAKGTFYVYFKDKNDLIIQILTLKHGTMLNEIMHESRIIAETEDISWTDTFVNMLVSHYQKHPAVLKLIQKNIILIMDTKEHQQAVFDLILDLEDFLAQMQNDHEDIRQTKNRFMMIMEIINNICYNALVYQQPDDMEHIIPILMSAMKGICEKGEQL